MTWIYKCAYPVMGIIVYIMCRWMTKYIFNGMDIQVLSLSQDIQILILCNTCQKVLKYTVIDKCCKYGYTVIGNIYVWIGH